MAQLRIMKHYMVEVYLPEMIDNNFINKIPMQRDKINELMQMGVILAYSLSMDRARLWITMLGENENTVEDTLQTFPLFEYFQYDIFELAFHNTIVHRLPELSLN
jgi:muconolactone delta-isomerase